jgi:hypothetical protein
MPTKPVCPVCESPLSTGDHDICKLLQRGYEDLREIKQAQVEYVVRVIELENQLSKPKAGNDEPK